MVAADVLTQGELATVKRFVESIRRRNEDELLDMAADDLEEAMTTIGGDCDVIWKQVRKRSALHTALLYAIFRHLAVHVPDLFADLRAFAEEFPEFDQHDENERWALLRFANAVHLMAHFIPPAQNKQVYMEVSSRLSSDFRRRFVTGGGQTPETADRVSIYERVGNVTKRRRPRRRLQGEIDEEDEDELATSSRKKRLERAAPAPGRRSPRFARTGEQKEVEQRDGSVEDSAVSDMYGNDDQGDQEDETAAPPPAKKLRNGKWYGVKTEASEFAPSAASISPTTTNELGEDVPYLPADSSSSTADDIEFVIKQPTWALYSDHIDIGFDSLQQDMIFDPTLPDPFFDFDF